MQSDYFTKKAMGILLICPLAVHGQVLMRGSYITNTLLWLLRKWADVSIYFFKNTTNNNNNNEKLFPLSVSLLIT